MDCPDGQKPVDTDDDGCNDACEGINECDGQPICDENATCNDLDEGYECICIVGYTGDGKVCVDVDECAEEGQGVCPDLMYCVNLPGSFACKCMSGTEPVGDGCKAFASPLVINEVDYDQPGVDKGDFLEIYNSSSDGIPLNGYAVILINGSNGNAYEKFLLSQGGQTLNPGQYLVIGKPALEESVGSALFIPLGSNQGVQNGPDGISILRLADEVIMDSIAYEGDMGMYGVGEGANGGKDSSSKDGSLSRCSNGVDSGDNGADFDFVSPSTPGAANSCATDCTPVKCVLPEKPVDTDNDGCADTCQGECEPVKCVLPEKPVDTDNDGCADTCEAECKAIVCTSEQTAVDTDEDGCADKCQCTQIIDCAPGFKPVDENNDGCAESCEASCVPVKCADDETPVDTDEDGCADECEKKCVPIKCPEGSTPVDTDNDGCADACVASCGGIAGKTCPSDSFCDYPAGMCKAADMMGTCEVVPEGCFEIYEPVCGCDGMTYGNDCKRQAAQAQLDHTGECTTDGCKEGATKEADDGCNTCTCTEGAWACTEMACPACNTDADCPEGQQCDAGICVDSTPACKEGATKEADDGCNTCTCTEGAWACTKKLCQCEVDDCGPKPGMPNKLCSDGVTMSGPGDCVLNEDGTCAWEIIECPAECKAGETKEVDCNTCTCADGAWACTEKVCPDCSDTKLCPEGQVCQNGVCKDKPAGCGTNVLCDMEAPSCPEGLIAVNKGDCWGCGYAATCSCSDGETVICKMLPPTCKDGQELAEVSGCYECVNPLTCKEESGCEAAPECTKEQTLVDSNDDGCDDKCECLMSTDCSDGYKPVDTNGDGCLDDCEEKCSPAPKCTSEQTLVDTNGDGCDDKCECVLAIDCAPGSTAIDTNGDGCFDDCKTICGAVPECTSEQTLVDTNGDGCDDKCECELIIDCMPGWNAIDTNDDGCSDDCKMACAVVPECTSEQKLVDTNEDGCDDTCECALAIDCMPGWNAIDTNSDGCDDDCEVAGCGGIVGDTCLEGQYCEMPAGMCGADLQGDCVTVEKSCTMNLDPVCGCNGKTYNNDCLRRMAMVPLDHTGECKSSSCTDGETKEVECNTCSCTDGAWACTEMVCPDCTTDADCEDGQQCDASGTCVMVLPPGCGDGKCNGDEDTTTCVSDCGSDCGDGACNGSETSINCPSDCGETPPDCNDGDTKDADDGCNTCICKAGEWACTAIACSDCAGDDDCPPGQQCDAGICVDVTLECVNDSGCGMDEPCKVYECKGNACVQTQSLVNGVSCGVGKVCEQGECVDDDTCKGAADCIDLDPCTGDSCVGGECLHEGLPNGTTCGEALECQQGLCVDVPPVTSGSVICTMSGGAGSTVDCALNMAAENGVAAKGYAAALTYIVYYDPTKFTFSDLSCPAFGGVLNTCSKTLASGGENIDQTLPPVFAGGPGHKLFVNENPKECDNCVKILIYTTVVPANAVSNAYLTGSGDVVGLDFVMNMQFSLVTDLNHEPVNVDLSDASDQEGNLLYLSVENERVVTGGACTEKPPTNCITGG